MSATVKTNFSLKIGDFKLKISAGMLWLDIEGPTYWKDQAFNRQFFEQMVSTAVNNGIRLGIYTSNSQWSVIMGNSYTLGSRYPLWYAHYVNS